MPKLWSETIEAHRREVRDAIVNTTAALVSERGLRSVTMSEIAEESGIGRATLYKYFPSVDEILHAWHERHVAEHLEQLTAVTDQVDEPGDRLEAVLRTYASITRHRSRGSHDPELAAFLHRVHQGEHATQAQQQLHRLLHEVVADAAETGMVRNDIAPDVLATYCLHAVEAARNLSSEADVSRLVDVILAGVRPNG